MLLSGVLPEPSKVGEMNEAKGKQERRPRKPKYRRPQKNYASRQCFGKPLTLKMLRVRFRNRYDINTILPIAI